ncbi:MAG: cyclic nucleotide-regulated FAD-dependent pyridine nucleotide-disulfide oxidoreductase [Mycobacterium sp.]|nr:cyclic nucleotide-regulated FAD-dependent pyridine nucleotide-disulfide oxidoreductase [Mycobacterium sp.]
MGQIMADRDRQPARESTGASPSSGSASAVPQLSGAQFDRMTAYGVAQPVQVGDVVFGPGDVDYDLILVESGWIEIISPATGDEPESVVARYGPGGFLGELNFLTGQTAYLMARVTEAGRIHRITRQQFRRVMAAEPDLSDILLRTFLARRDLLRDGPAARAIAILGSELSADSLALRTFAARQRLAHLWLDADSAAGRALAASAQITGADLPAVITGHRVLRRATTGQMAQALGLAYRHTGTKPSDLTVIGSGPAGLGAAVYGASEGLNTVVLDAVGLGGQAAASSRIENYLGFPSGLSGQELTQRAALQAMKFGAQLSSPCRVVDLDTDGAHLSVMLSDGTTVESRAVLIATGVRYKTLPLERWIDFEGAGIYYAATELEARACRTEPVTVVGGANSAGQAALYLASRGCQVTLAVRGSDVAATMSSYLLGRLRADPRVTIRADTEVTGLSGGSSLQRITLTNNSTGDIAEHLCAGLFCFIGARPETEWLADLALDRAGFIRTDAQLDPEELGATWAALGRTPLPFETSMPTVFAAGDVRLTSVKRVASAVGEGASAVRSIHTALGAHP